MLWSSTTSLTNATSASRSVGYRGTWNDGGGAGVGLGAAVDVRWRSVVTAETAAALSRAGSPGSVATQISTVPATKATTTTSAAIRRRTARRPGDTCRAPSAIGDGSIACTGVGDGGVVILE